MNNPPLIRALFLTFLFTLSGCAAVAANDDEEVWAPTPPRVSFIDGEVSYWRPGTEEWAAARANLPLAEGDALYAGSESNFEVQFGTRNFVRADENSQIALVELEEGRIQFQVTSGRVSFDLRRLSAGNRLEVSTPSAVFLIEDPGYYRVEVDSRETHFITRRGGEATLTTADGRSLSIFPSEDIVVTAGTPVKVATYAAPPPDAWDRWNDERSDRIGESASARYLPPDVYGAEELDHYGHWRVVATYGSVWIPYGVSASWAPYSTGYWVWDPYYEWTWVDDAPWGWAPFHYGRWVLIDGFWAWAPGPVVRRSVYAPALVGFMVAGSGVSVNISVGLPVWWVALGWGEPVVPWWHRHRYHGRPRWDGWGGPRIVNNREFRDSPFTNVAEIRYRNADLQRRAILTVPPDKFGRDRQHATVETRYRSRDFTPLRGEVPIKPSRESLYGGAPKGLQPPREIVTRPVVTTRQPRQPASQPWQLEESQRAATPRQQTRQPEQRFVIPPRPKEGERRPFQRPPFGADAGPELTPPPQPPRYGDVKRSTTLQPRSQPEQPAPPAQRQQQERRERAIRSGPQPGFDLDGERREQRQQQQQERFDPGGEQREQQQRERREQQQRPLPGRPANQPHQKRDRD
jgi:hypothetical protein